MEADRLEATMSAARLARVSRIRAERANRAAAMAERYARAGGRPGPYLGEARRLRVLAVHHLVDAHRFELAAGLADAAGEPVSAA
jgi:hypothetical protein